jgi:hypothetical protein
MKGATAEDSEKTSNTPTSTRKTTSGKSHIFLRTLRNSQSSTMMLTLLMEQTVAKQGSC